MLEKGLDKVCQYDDTKINFISMEIEHREE
jgi:hypothetical protein